MHRTLLTFVYNQELKKWRNIRKTIFALLNGVHNAPELERGRNLDPARQKGNRQQRAPHTHQQRLRGLQGPELWAQA